MQYSMFNIKMFTNICLYQIFVSFIIDICISRFDWNIFVKYLRGWRDVDRLDGKSGVGGQNKVLSHNIQRQKIFTYYDIMDAFGICELENNEKAEFRKKIE